MIRKVRPHPSQNEPLLFEISSPGKSAYQLPDLDVPDVDPATALGARNVRAEIEGFPEVSEVEAIRHFTRLSTWNYAIDLGLYPLRLLHHEVQPAVNEQAARVEGLAWAHPYQPESLSQGAMEIMAMLERALMEITGMDAVTLQPAAGAHGELTGILLIRALLESQGNRGRGSWFRIRLTAPIRRRRPPRATRWKTSGSCRRGMVDVATLAAAVNEDVAALMITNPNTLGVFEADIVRVAEILHAKGAQLYMDGANMNALVGVARPGDFGVDVMHLNLPQDVLHAARRRRSGQRAGGRKEAPGAIPPGPAPGASG